VPLSLCGSLAVIDLRFPVQVMNLAAVASHELAFEWMREGLFEPGRRAIA